MVELEYHDYARSKYLALGLKDTMPREVTGPVLLQPAEGIPLPLRGDVYISNE